MKKINFTSSKLFVLAMVGGFVLSAGSCNDNQNTSNPSTSLTEEEIGKIKKCLADDGNFAQAGLVQKALEKVCVTIDEVKNSTICTFTSNGLLTEKPGTKDGSLELNPKLATAMNITDNGVKFANSTAEQLVKSTAFSNFHPLKISAVPNTCVVTAVSV